MIPTHTLYNYIYRQIVLHDPGGEKRNKGNLVFCMKILLAKLLYYTLKNYLKKIIPNLPIKALKWTNIFN